MALDVSARTLKSRNSSFLPVGFVQNFSGTQDEYEANDAPTHAPPVIENARAHTSIALLGRAAARLSVGNNTW